MLFKDVIYLIKISITKNDLKDPVESETKTKVFADRLGINQSEAYQAMAQGIKPAVRFKLRASEYDDQERLEYKSKKYKIIRKYDADDEFVELVAEALVK